VAEKPAEKQIPKEVEKDVKETLGEKEPLAKKVLEWIKETTSRAAKNMPAALAGLKTFSAKAGSVLKPKIVVSVLLIFLLAGGVYLAYLQGWPEMAQKYVAGFFTPKPTEKEVPFVVEVNPEDLREFGFVSVAIFAKNSGSVNDRVPVQIRMADYFGRLKEPRVKGETGISAATFYGELKDSAGTLNQFVVYMDKLEEVQNLYSTDVYAMLDRSTERDKELLVYLDRLKEAREVSGMLLSQIGADMDGLKVSYDSLTPDKTNYEKDFFSAMDALQSEKSDVLLKGFIDVSQKQIALKARVSALNKLVGYYENVIKRLDIRILAIEQNKDALIKGIRVVDIPGANLDIIIRPQTTNKQ
jgi:hypothetical protein